MQAADILHDRGLLSRQQLDQARNGHPAGSFAAVEAAIEQGLIEEETALTAVGEELGLDYIDLSNVEVDHELLASFPQRLIYRQNLFPIRRDNGALVVATADPYDLYPIDEAGAATGLPIIPVLAGRQELAKLIKKYMGVGGETVDGLVAQQEDDEDSIELMDEIQTDGSETVGDGAGSLGRPPGQRNSVGSDRVARQ